MEAIFYRQYYVHTPVSPPPPPPPICTGLNIFEATSYLVKVSKPYISELEPNIMLVRIKLNKFQNLPLLYTEIFCSHMLIT